MNRLRRFLPYIGLALLLVGLSLPAATFSTPALAADGPELTLTQGPSTSGSIDVNIVLNEIVGATAFEFVLTFDPDFVVPDSLTMTDSLGATSSCNPDNTRCALALGPRVLANESLEHRYVGGYSFGTGDGFSGDATVAVMRLATQDVVGETTLILENVRVLDADATALTVPETVTTTITIASVPTAVGLQSAQANSLMSWWLLIVFLLLGSGLLFVSTRVRSRQARLTLLSLSILLVTVLFVGSLRTTAAPVPHLDTALLFNTAARSTDTPMNPDTNRDAVTDIFDIMRVAAARGLASTPELDINYDDVMTDDDTTLVANRWRTSLTAIASSSPADSEDGVAITRETIAYFSRAVDAASVISDTLTAQFGGDFVSSRLQVASDGKKATLFYPDELPASARIRVALNGDAWRDAEGYGVDVNGDGLIGGTQNIDFDTLSLTVIPDTSVCGRVFASEHTMSRSGVALDEPLEGVRITVDGLEETLFSVTDSSGNFCLDPTPAGNFFVHIDGRTVTRNVRDGAYYPFVGKQWHSQIGQQTNIGDIYLPLIPPETLQPVSAITDTEIQFPAAVIAANPELAEVSITVPANSLFADDGSQGGMVGIAAVAPDRLPGALPDGLSFPLVITIQTDGASNFDIPAPICFPNLPDPNTTVSLPAGAKSALWSFDHDIGRFAIVGPMTVSEDGMLVCTDEGGGVLEPGWHSTLPRTNVSGPSSGPDGPCGGPSGGSGGPDGPNAQLKKKADKITKKFRFARPLYCDLEFRSSCQANCAMLAEHDSAECSNPVGACLARCAADHAKCLLANRESTTTELLDTSLIYNASRTSITSSQDYEDSGLYYYSVEQIDPISLAVISTQRGTVHSDTESNFHMVPLFLAPNSLYIHRVLQAHTLRVSQVIYGTPDAGSSDDLPPFVFGIEDSDDDDNDGLGNIAESIVGTDANQSDTDNDGQLDVAEIQLGTNPLDGIPVATGIIASVDTAGIAVDVCALNNLAAVADSAMGVSVFNIFNGMNPSIISQVDTPATAKAVACANNLIAAATSSGVSIIDISDPPAAFIAHQAIPSYNITSVSIAGSVIYAGSTSGAVFAIDLATGGILAQASIEGLVHDVKVSGDFVYVLSPDRLYTFDTFDAGFNQTSDVGHIGSGRSNGSRMRLSAGSNILYATHARGYNTYDLTNPAAPVQLAIGETAQFGWSQIVDNGSGLGLVAMGLNSTNSGQHHVHLYDVSDPNNTDVFLTTFETPGLARAVTIYNGFAYVADGSAGLQIINYLASDTSGEAPVIDLTTNFTPGLAEEGQRLRVTANVNDNVQIRSVTFFVDGERRVVDGNYPFEYQFVTPQLAQQATFSLTSRAVDTGGNVTQSDTELLTMVPDAAPPRVNGFTPLAIRMLSGEADGISVTFSEPIDETTLAAALDLIGAGADDLLDTSDDVTLISGTISYREDTNTAFLSFAEPLPDDFYRATVNTTLADLAGNLLAGSITHQFSVGSPVAWDGGGDGVSWNDPDNWNIDALPTENDIVIIDVPGDLTVEVSGGDITVYGIQSSETLKLNGGTFNISDRASVLQSLTLQGGTLSGGADVRVDDLLWESGTLRGSGTLEVSSSLVITGSSNHLLRDSRVLNNAGNGVWHNGTITSYDTVTFNNLAGATFDIQHVINSTANSQWSRIGGGASINNFGIWRKSAHDRTVHISPRFNSSGTVDVQQGTLAVGAGESSGEWTGSGTGRVVITGDYVFHPAAVIQLPELVLEGNNVTLNTSPTSFTLASGTVTGTADITSTALLWEGGTLRGSGTLEVSSSLVITSSSNHLLRDSRVLSNAGNGVWHDGRITSYDTATFNNLAGATFDIQQATSSTGNSSWSFSGSGGGTSINNFGTWRKSGNVSTNHISPRFNSSGTVDVQQGTLSVRVGESSGAWTGSGTGRVVITGDYVFHPAAMIQLPELVLEGNNVTLNTSPTSFTLASGAVTGTANITTTALLWEGGSLRGSGTLEVSSSLVITGSSNHELRNSRVLNNAGNGVWHNGRILSYDTATFNNLAGATFDIQHVISSSANSHWTHNGSGSINNSGTWRKSANDGTIQIYPPFSNNGTVDVQQGTLTLQEDYVNGSTSVIRIFIASLTDFGRFSINGEATLNGTLDIVLENGYEPNIGDSFEVIAFQTHVNTFDSITGLTIGNGKQFSSTTSSDSIVLTVVPQ